MTILRFMTFSLDGNQVVGRLSQTGFITAGKTAQLSGALIVAHNCFFGQLDESYR